MTIEQETSIWERAKIVGTVILLILLPVAFIYFIYFLLSSFPRRNEPEPSVAPSQEADFADYVDASAPIFIYKIDHDERCAFYKDGSIRHSNVGTFDVLPATTIRPCFRIFLTEHAYARHKEHFSLPATATQEDIQAELEKIKEAQHAAEVKEREKERKDQEAEELKNEVNKILSQ